MDCNSHRNKLRRAPFTARWRACSEPNNLAIVWPNPYTTPQNINTRHSAGVYILVGVGGFPRTALSRRLWGIPNDLTARCLSNLLIVEPVVLISPLHHKIKMPHSGHFDFGGSGWIRTTSGLSQQIYSLPRLSCSARLRQRLRWAMDFQPLLRCGENPWCGQRESNPHFKLGRLAY